MASVVLYSTRAEGYWWKAPSWPDGRKLEQSRGEAVELEAEDLAEFDRYIKEGHPLRYEMAAPVAAAAEPPAPAKKGK